MTHSSLAVLCSGGLDSAVLLAESARSRPVTPIYVRSGLTWESVELPHLLRFLGALSSPSLRPLVTLDVPVADLYGSHWSLTGRDVPDGNTSDDAVYLPGRNVILLAKAMVWCHLHGVTSIALGVLAGNPFPDATPEFFRSLASTVNRAIGGSVGIETPFAGFSKIEVLRRGRDLPLQDTFSCIAPVQGHHCGRCNKCAERQRAFQAAGMIDPTVYHVV